MKLTVLLACLHGRVASAAVSLSDIQSWVGSGPNSAGMVIDWDDGSLEASQLWGYHWTGTATGAQMLDAIIAADPHLYALFSTPASYGTAVFGLGIDFNGDGLLPLSPPLRFTNQSATSNYNGVDDSRMPVAAADQWQEGWYTAGYWSYWTSNSSRLSVSFNDWSYTGSGSASRVLSNGDWDGWSFSRNFVDRSPASPLLAQYASRPPISVAAGQTVILSSNIAAGSLCLAGSTGTWTGKLDIGSSKVAIQSGDLSQLTNQIAEGFNHGGWNGPGGIVSSAAASDGRQLTAIGIISNRGGNGVAIHQTFGGQGVTTADILIGLTWYGDADLNGQVDGSDYSRIDAAYIADQSAPGSATGWFNGDFNYDGIIDGSDYTLIDDAFNSQGAAAMASGAAIATEIASNTVPEPATAAVSMGLTGLACFQRRHRRQSVQVVGLHRD